MWNCKTLRHQQRNMVSFVLKYFNKLIWVMSIKSFTIKDRTNQLYICDHSHVPNSTGSKLILLGFFRSIQQDDKSQPISLESNFYRMTGTSWLRLKQKENIIYMVLDSFFLFFLPFSFVCIFLLFLLINYMYLMRKGIGKKITKIQKRFRRNLELKKRKKKWEIPFYHINLRKPSSPKIKNMDEN